MIQPALLKSGDSVVILAPGRKPEQQHVTTSVSLLQSWGLNVILGDNLFSDRHNYLSGADIERLSDLQQALNNNAVRAIICARGGYGTTRFLDLLDFSTFQKSPKWICGFSDITALHLKLQTLGVQSIHSAMPVQFAKPEFAESAESLRQLLFGNAGLLKATFSTYNRNGKASGSLVGGNLSLLADSLGTSSEIQTENKILVIEEIDEYAYRLDRMLVQLKRAGKLDKLAALVVGHLTDIKAGELPFGETAEEIILNQVKEFDYPVAFNFSTGHDNPNLAWVEGAQATLSVTNEKSVLNFQTSL